MIRVLICDGDGTLPFAEGGVADFVKQLADLGIELAVATNNASANIVRRFQRHGLTPPATIVSKHDIGSKGKPAPDLVYAVSQRMGVGRNEIAFLGDDDKTDIFCAFNAGVLPLAASYSSVKQQLDYGIPMHDIPYLIRYLSLYATQNPPLFGWTYSGTCVDTGHDIDIKSLLYQHSEIPYFKELIKGLIEPEKAVIGPREIGLLNILANYLVTRIFLSGEYESEKSTLVTVYPGHKQNTENQLLKAIAGEFKNVFRAYSRNLLVRHTDAPASKMQGADRDIYDQFRTIIVNPAEKEHIAGKQIIVLDDYTTTGNSLEVARRMLIQAGASRVTCIAMGKWRHDHVITRIAKDWNPYKPNGLKASDISVHVVRGTPHSAADQSFNTIISELERN